MINYLTKKGENGGNAKVLFSCHPSDFKKWFPLLTNEILANRDCTIYYLENQDYNPEDLDDYESTLNEFSLAVFPITAKFLSEASRARDIDLKRCMETRMNILPIMVEPYLYNDFNKLTKIQVLDRTSKDPTQESYSTKLKKYLGVTIQDEKMVERIKKAFDAYIFLSYRKKDRKYAQEVMSMIHSNDFMRDIAIWYDEFLVLGENFNEEIMENLVKSKLMTLVVTPNVVEKSGSEDNYVVAIEYPTAMKESKIVIPIEAIFTEKDELKKSFKDMSDPYTLEDADKIAESFMKLLYSEGFKENNDPEHLFYIGLAYLDGIDVERNFRRGFELINRSAKGGFLPAMKKASELYIESGYDLEGFNLLREYVARTDNPMDAIDERLQMAKLSADFDMAMGVVDDIIEYGDGWNDKRLCEALYVSAYVTTIGNNVDFNEAMECIDTISNIHLDRWEKNESTVEELSYLRKCVYLYDRLWNRFNADEDKEAKILEEKDKLLYEAERMVMFYLLKGDISNEIACRILVEITEKREKDYQRHEDRMRYDVEFMFNDEYQYKSSENHRNYIMYKSLCESLSLKRITEVENEDRYQYLDRRLDVSLVAFGVNSYNYSSELCSRINNEWLVLRNKRAIREAWSKYLVDIQKDDAYSENTKRCLNYFQSAFYKIGEYELAINAFEKFEAISLQIDGKYPEKTKELGDCYKRIGKQDEATVIFEECYSSALARLNGKMNKYPDFGTEVKLMIDYSEKCLRNGNYQLSIDILDSLRGYVAQVNKEEYVFREFAEENGIRFTKDPNGCFKIDLHKGTELLEAFLGTVVFAGSGIDERELINALVDICNQTSNDSICVNTIIRYGHHQCCWYEKEAEIDEPMIMAFKDVVSEHYLEIKADIDNDARKSKIICTFNFNWQEFFMDAGVAAIQEMLKEKDKNIDEIKKLGRVISVYWQYMLNSRAYTLPKKLNDAKRDLEIFKTVFSEDDEVIVLMEEVCKKISPKNNS